MSNFPDSFVSIPVVSLQRYKKVNLHMIFIFSCLISWLTKAFLTVVGKMLYATREQSVFFLLVGIAALAYGVVRQTFLLVKKSITLLTCYINYYFLIPRGNKG